jgi:hypothetical protein
VLSLLEFWCVSKPTSWRGVRSVFVVPLAHTTNVDEPTFLTTTSPTPQKILFATAQHPSQHLLFEYSFSFQSAQPICTIINMKSIITASLLLLVLTSANAFSSAPRSNLFREQANIPKVRTARQNEMKSPRTPSSSLSAVPAAAAVAGAVTGGLFAGGLHAIAGKLIYI